MKPLDPKEISITDYTYELPEERIAKFPLNERDQSKLLVYRNGKIEDDRFYRLFEHLDPDCLLIFNSTRVIPARLLFKTKEEKTVEIFCLEPALEGSDPSPALRNKSPVVWDCLVGNLKHWKNEDLILQNNTVKLAAKLLKKHKGHSTVEFSWSDLNINFGQILELFGAIPIPPYLGRPSEGSNYKNYQTIFAEQPGSVAAPTAALHFTSEVMDKLKEKGISFEHLVLHVGAGTFKPVKSEKLIGHEMHQEWMEVDVTMVKNLATNGTKQWVAVGTTSLRTLESLYWMGVKVLRNQQINLPDLEIQQWEVYQLTDEGISVSQSYQALYAWMERRNMRKLVCKTGILIAPPYRVKTIKALITNFHQPQSTLLLLVAAYVGGNWKEIYKHAAENDYRFLSYGDSMLLWP